MSDYAVLVIAANEAKHAAEKEITLEGRLKAAMSSMKNFWLSIDDDLRFRGAIGGVLLLSNEEDSERIMRELSGLRAMGAMLSGVPVDFERVEIPENPLGLVKMWEEIKKG